MKKLLLPLILTLLCYAAFIFIIHLTPYITGPVATVAESDGAIPANLWLSMTLRFIAGVNLVASILCQFWLGTKFGVLLDERREQRKKHDKGI